MGAAFDVHSELGCGFLEAVYQEALGRELRDRGIPYAPKQRIQIRFKGELLEQYYEAGFVCYGKIILELKATKANDVTHQGQLHNYLKATGFQLGILLNFGANPKLTYQRIIHT